MWSRDAASNSWIARAVVIGALIVVVLWIVGQVLGALFAPLRLIGQSVTCQTNVFHLSRAFRLYEDDYDQRIPPAEEWMDRTFFYINAERYLHCPSVVDPSGKSYGYAMNSNVAGKDRSEILRPEESVIVYDSTNLKRSAFDPELSLPQPGRHRTKPRKGSPSKPGNYIGYADGSARIELDEANARARKR